MTFPHISLACNRKYELTQKQGSRSSGYLSPFTVSFSYWIVDATVTTPNRNKVSAVVLLLPEICIISVVK